MKREEILAMEPGRELDAMVAECLFDASVKWVSVVDFQGHRMEPYHIDSDEGHGPCDEVSEYSTQISAAWQVVEKISGSGPYKSRSLMIMDEISKGYEVRFYEGCSRLSTVVAPSAPEAICKAALLAVLST